MTRRGRSSLLVVLALTGAALALPAASSSTTAPVFNIAEVADGDTITLRAGRSGLAWASDRE
jgi:hypothetical protein